MGDGLVIPIDGLVGHPEETRQFSGRLPVSLRLGEVTVDGPMSVSGVLTGMVDGVLARFTTSATAHVVCGRCLTEWDEEVGATATQLFRKEPDEDGYRIVDKTVDIAACAIDELAMSLPATPLCREECKGLCPICGTDLNSAPCDGHEEDLDSPFAALKDLFDP